MATAVVFEELLRTVLSILMERELEFLAPDPAGLTGESGKDD